MSRDVMEAKDEANWYLERTFQREGTQMQTREAGMRLAYSPNCKASVAGTGSSGGHGHQLWPKNFQPTVHHHLTTPPGALWCGQVGVGRRDERRKADSFIHASNKYILSTYDVAGAVLENGLSPSPWEASTQQRQKTES